MAQRRARGPVFCRLCCFRQGLFGSAATAIGLSEKIEAALVRAELQTAGTIVGGAVGTFLGAGFGGVVGGLVGSQLFGKAFNVATGLHIGVKRMGKSSCERRFGQFPRPGRMGSLVVFEPRREPCRREIGQNRDRYVPLVTMAKFLERCPKEIKSFRHALAQDFPGGRQAELSRLRANSCWPVVVSRALAC